MTSLSQQPLFLGSNSQPHFPFCVLWLIPCRQEWEMGVILQFCCGCPFALRLCSLAALRRGQMLSLTLSQLVLPFLYPQIAKLSEASGITSPTTPCASTPLSTQSHTSSTSLGSFPGRCLELTLFSTPFSMLFAICVSYHRFGTPHTSPSLP